MRSSCAKRLYGVNTVQYAPCLMRDHRRDGVPHGNLPLELDSFVGRGRELAQLGRALDAGRLVTVTGAGGV
ncbi:hypothetical protein GTW93_25635, partial [Streptomyces sp. SID5789]|nr:hypothetical protein [Streptomyces sp. SID5789]